MSDQDLQRKLARAELSRRAFIVCIAMVTALVVGALLTLSIQVRQTQLEGTPTGRRLLQSSDLIVSCTTPEGECYKRGQARTADAIATLNLATLYAVYCVDRNPAADIPAIQQCVRNLYEKNAETE